MRGLPFCRFVAMAHGLLTAPDMFVCRSSPAGRLLHVVPRLALPALLACSSSPDSTEVYVYDLQQVDAGVLSLEEHPEIDGGGTMPWPCDGACMQTLRSESSSCESACAAIEGGLRVIDCSFGHGRQSLRCTVQFPGQHGGGCIVDG